MLFKDNNKYVEKDVTASEAKKIYELLKTMNESGIRREKGFRMHKIKQVVSEIKRLESEVNVYMTGKPGTKDSLVKSLSSKLLDVVVVVDDIIKYSKNDTSVGVTWTSFKAGFKEVL